MPQENNPDAAVYAVVCMIALLLLIPILYSLCTFIRDFSQELTYLNNEINRTAGAERRHYLRMRRRLWLSLIPFVKY